MKILSAIVENFASYKHLEFKFDEQGLTLISGPTGAGKSTICDIIPWVLFGTTAKNGTVDEIRSWNSDGLTSGEIVISSTDGTINVYRSRNPIDLCFGVNGSATKRGKDLADTQKQINQLLGMTAETYLAGAYFHEFSQTAQFFNTTAKNRRVITEQLADLTLPKTLHEKLSIYSKDLKKECAELAQDLLLKKNTLECAQKSYYDTWHLVNGWDERQERKIVEIAVAAENHDRLKEKNIESLEQQRAQYIVDRNNTIASIYNEVVGLKILINSAVDCKTRQQYLKQQIQEMSESRCSSCGAPQRSHDVMVATKNLYDIQHEQDKAVQHQLRIDGLETRAHVIDKQVNPFVALLEQARNSENTYLEQLEALRLEINPNMRYLEGSEAAMKTDEYSIQCTETLLKDFNIEQSDIELLLEVVSKLRSTIIENTCVYLSKTTNALLDKHFDAEIRIGLISAESDKIEVSIMKDGNQCSYTQLSKGQRQLLKLSFGVSVMQAISNHSGVDFNCLWFDEALDGMDDNTKAKAFGLLDSIARNHDSVFVVEHSDSFKSLFSNRIDVKLVNGESQVEKA